MLARSQTATVIRDARSASLKRIYYPSPLPRLRQRQRAFASSAPALGRDALAGSVVHHSAYVFLHAHAPPSAPAFPARSKSPLWRALTLKARAWGAIANFSWAPAQPVHPAYTGLGEEGTGRAWGWGRGAGEGQSESEGEGQEAYVASVFSTALGRLHVPEVSLGNLDAVDAELRALCAPESESPLTLSPRSSSAQRNEELVQQVDDRRLLLYVCTHGSRDCRCGQAGGDVARALRAQVARRGLADAVFVGDAAHVGGHKFAANVLVYPYGDWLGRVQEADVPRILDELLARHALHRDTDWRARADPLPPLCPPFWRGRMGLEKDGQLALASASRIA